ncbi:MAG: peptidoglycan DD-metalloendopeptidase family protein [Thermodesulfobacteriota bacterium]|nr:peptidoglycan DD-metalloendopeptidase family protein [Thermodesulfobacteriota bacterium]
MKRLIDEILNLNHTITISLFLTVLATGVLTGVGLIFSSLLDKTKTAPSIEGELISQQEEIQSFENETLPLAKSGKTIEQTLVREDTLFDLFVKNDIDPKELPDLLKASKKIYNLNRLTPGNRLELEVNTENSKVHHFRYEINEDEVLLIDRSNNGFFARKEKLEHDIRLDIKSGVISNSLFEAVIKEGLPSEISLDLGEIFAWDIDFNVDLRKGDRFRILFEKKYRNGDFLRNGRILCAQFINQENQYWGILFKDNEGHIDYYDLDGNSLKKKFLKSPLRYRYISSGYSKRRLHPILKIYRPHLGIDYAAPTGTPVVTVGDGKVILAGWQKGFGRTVKIRHNSTYTTLYGHLSRYGKGIKTNRNVKQGQVIGYVGSTGLSTGPHLDYRLIKNGSYINPLSYNPPSAKPVNKKYVEDFEKLKKEMIQKLKVVDFVPEQMAADKEQGSVLNRPYTRFSVIQ